MSDTVRKVPSFDERFGGVWNFYYALTGEWPNNGREEESFTNEERWLLHSLILSVPDGKDVCKLYGIWCERTDEVSVYGVQTGLENLRKSDVLDEILAVYGDVPKMQTPLLRRLALNGKLDNHTEKWIDAFASRIKYLEEENAALKAEKTVLDDDRK